MLRKRVFEILEVSEGDRVSRGFDIFILTLIVLNIFALILETVEPIYRLSPVFFKTFEWVSMVIFSVEYVLRIWVSVENPETEGSIKSRFKYMTSFYGLVDLLAILPFYLPFIGGDFRFVRAVRLFRLFRILKLARYSFALSGLKRVLHRKMEELICVGFLLALLLVIASSSMYFLEHEVQPGAFSSIPATMWWGVVTLTTVGYGDVYPITFMGKILGAMIAILGIGLFALPAGLIGGAYLEELEERRNKKKMAAKTGGPRSGVDRETGIKQWMFDVQLQGASWKNSVEVIRKFLGQNFIEAQIDSSVGDGKSFQCWQTSDHLITISKMKGDENLFFLDWRTRNPDWNFNFCRDNLLDLLNVVDYAETLMSRGALK
ncbi:MAG: ion transporter [Candidatus Nitronauta litoralis]|uniref:Ion transporter n=1 Tax=Candidatus Nitronauta litoralis TaxID=2705533 RepID=A0A7T0BTX3_9BACT|nr:MAG: ion transporter [Candidatus Nitronauta litoralis]